MTFPRPSSHFISSDLGNKIETSIKYSEISVRVKQLVARARILYGTQSGSDCKYNVVWDHATHDDGSDYIFAALLVHKPNGHYEVKLASTQDVTMVAHTEEPEVIIKLLERLDKQLPRGSQKAFANKILDMVILQTPSA